MIQLNLLPDVKKEFLRAQRMRSQVIAFSIFLSIIAVGATVLVAVYVYGGQQLFIGNQTSDINKKAKELLEVKDLSKYLTIQNQLSNISTLHEGKNDFSRLMVFLPQLNPLPPDNITLLKLDLSAADNSLIFKGKVKDYKALNTFKDTLLNATYTYADGEKTSDEAKLFSQVNVVSAAMEYNAEKQISFVGFTINTTYDPVAFVHKNEKVVLKVPNKETTQSVVNSPQLFEGSR